MYMAAGVPPWLTLFITNIARCMAFKAEVEGGVVYCSIVVQWYCTIVDNASGGRQYTDG